MRIRHAAALALTAAVIAASCGSDDGDASTGDTPDVVAGEAFPDERCAANEAAGTITYLTGFDYAAAA